MVDEGWKSVLIFEDDIKFEPYFRDWMEMMLGEIKDNEIEWDLMWVKVPHVLILALKSILLLYVCIPFNFHLEPLYHSPCSYIGRKRLHIDDEYKLDGFETLITPKYSYWTLCYMISLSGAKKLLAQNPLQKILPVDEYFPIMFNEHPR